MSKFNEGEIVEVFKTGTPFSVGEKVRLVTKDSDDDWLAEYLDGSDCWYVTEDEVRYTTSNSKENKPMGRRTFKLIKETPEYKVGTLFQEACDDGDQEYIVITRDLLKFEDANADNQPSYERVEVETQPQWFVEVFKVEPEYMTREQLDAFEAFKKQKVAKVTPKYNKSGKYAKKAPKKAVKLSKNGKRLGRPPKGAK